MKGNNSKVKDQNATALDLGGPLLLKNRFWWHVLFWACFFFYEWLIWGLVDDAYTQRMTISLIELPIKMIATYFTLYILIDRFLVKKKYASFVILLLTSMLFFGVLLRVQGYYVIYPMYYPEALGMPVFFLPKIFISISYIYAVVAILSSFHLIRHWYRHQQATQLLQQRAQDLQNEKLEAELKLLKSQINPHFLFNTLNNLYSLSLRNSDKTPEVVYKLSELMSYMLYDSNLPEVALQKEIKYIENYIALEKIRYDGRLDISMNVYDDISGIKIAPLLILPFVENSFKHGVSNQIVKGWIRIDISLKNQVLVIKVENSKGTPEEEKSVRLSSGIGLQNVRKRLSLIYPDRHTLQIYDEEETFLVILRISPEAKTADMAKSNGQVAPVAAP